MSDVDLVARARAGDQAAFGELVDRHRTAVYRAALAALGSHGDAEDAAQDAFLLAYRRLGSFRGDASFKTWLLTITWHQAINRRRSLTDRQRRDAASTPTVALGRRAARDGLADRHRGHAVSRPFGETGIAGCRVGGCGIAKRGVTGRSAGL